MRTNLTRSLHKIRKAKPEVYKIEIPDGFIYVSDELEEILKEIEKLTNVMKKLNDKSRYLQHQQELALPGSISL